MPTVVCAHCGYHNPETADGEARFCAGCGRPLSRPDATSTLSITGLEGLEGDDGGELTDAAALDALPEGSALLIVRRGPSAGSRFLLDRDLTSAGRHPDSDIFLDDVTVSRRHAEFLRQAGGFVVRDVGSLNGTYLNRERIEEASLTNGDEVQVGKFRLVFLGRAAAAPEDGTDVRDAGGSGGADTGRAS